jgi:polysaccharide export outer membrane protein
MGQYVNRRNLLPGLLPLLWLVGCTTLPEVPPIAERPVAEDFEPVEETSQEMAGKADLALLEESEEPVYLFGSGDILQIDVYGREEVSGRHVIGPDGVITLPLVGDVRLAGMTREQARGELTSRLRPYFTHPHVTIGVQEYVSNQVTVLGRVESPGRQRFDHPPTLAEVLANAGALPILDKQATLTRCAIMRGRNKLIWVDLKALLNGDLAYNISMKKGDIVFIPDSADTSVYVLGAVITPGSYRLTPGMTILDALAQAGGPSRDAQPREIGVYRAGAKAVQILEFGAIIAPDRQTNFALEDGDVVFVPESGLARFGYAMRQIAPAIAVLTFSAALGVP